MSGASSCWRHVGRNAGRMYRWLQQNTQEIPARLSCTAIVYTAFFFTVWDLLHVVCVHGSLSLQADRQHVSLSPCIQSLRARTPIHSSSPCLPSAYLHVHLLCVSMFTFMFTSNMFPCLPSWFTFCVFSCLPSCLPPTCFHVYLHVYLQHVSMFTVSAFSRLPSCLPSAYVQCCLQCISCLPRVFHVYLQCISCLPSV